MNYFDLYSSYPDHTIAAAWESQVKEADNALWLTASLTECGGELFERFAACYAQLRALPRSARRTLQRRLARSTELARILPEYLQQGGRRLQHRMAWSLAGAALLLALGQGLATAATITVTTNNPNIASDGQCSLIEAIINANNDAATHPDCPAGSGADTIVLPANSNITLSNTTGVTQYGATIGLPLITSRITIEGNGATVARQANAPVFRLMSVDYPGDLTLQNMTLTGGSSVYGGAVSNSATLTIKNCTISGNTSSSGGGGVYSYYGDLTVESSTISGNTTASKGGGLSHRFGRLTIINSTVSGNIANKAGGVYMRGFFPSDIFIVKNSAISGNTGGGVNNSIGTSIIENSTISRNTADFGAGVYNYGGAVSIESSTISGNRADVGGGGIYNGSGVFAGGRLTIMNSTVSGNSAGSRGGGLVNSNTCPLGLHCGSGPAALTLNNSLIAGNQANFAPEMENISSVVNANNFNLFGTNGKAGVTGFTPGPSDIVPDVPLAKILGPLQNNGGSTQTHALVDGSPALDAGDPSGCRDIQGAVLSTDQRGFARHVDSNNDGAARCDIGAFEAKELFVVAAVLPSSRSVQLDSPATAFATIINAGQAQATGCTISPITGIPATLTYQTTDPATNQVIGFLNTTVDIPAGAAQSFIFALTPTGPMAPTDVQLSFECANANPAPIHSGVNTLLFSASATPVPDIVALAATLNNDGIVNISGTNGMGVFAVAAVNVGAGDTLTVSADTGGAILPVNIFVCQTDPQTSTCLSPPAISVPATILSNETPTFGVFVTGAGDVFFVPETNRIFVRFQGSGGVTRGLTSVAVRTQ